jgi:hypothetical protein
MLGMKQSGPDLLPILPAATKAAGFFAMVSRYSDALGQLQLQLPASSSGSSRQTAGVAQVPTSERDLTQWAWQVAAAHQQQLPDPPPALAECMGVSKLLLVWLAAYELGDTSFSGGRVSMSSVLCMWYNVLHGQQLLLLQYQQPQPQRMREHAQLLAGSDEQQLMA